MSVNEKMTALADAIRDKAGIIHVPPYATNYLSIDGMTEAVKNLSVPDDVGTMDTEPSDVSEGKKYYIYGSDVKTGTMPDVTATIDGNKVTVPAGRIRTAQTLTVESGSVTLDGDTVTITEGYVENGTLTVPSGSVSISGRTVTIEEGYVNDDTLTVQSGNVTLAGGKVIVEEGYVDADEIDIPGSDFYLCSAVFGPKKVDGIIIAGAGTAEVNGDYELTEFKSESDGFVYKHATREYYYYELWGEFGISSNYTDPPSSEALYFDWGEGWTTGTGSGDPPTVTEGEITINKNVPKTWNGYKATWVDGSGYLYLDGITTGMSYGGTLVPEVGWIYDSAARIQVAQLFETVKPITQNDMACLIYIDGTSLTNQALSPNKHEVTFGSGVSLIDGYVNMTNDESGQILTTARADGFGGALKSWTWDFYFLTDADMLDCSGHSQYGWCLEGGPGAELYFRGHPNQRLGVTLYKNELVGLSMQYENGVLHIWDKGKYIGKRSPSFPNCDGQPFGIGCIADGDYDRMADNIKLFRFSNKARYIPGEDFTLPDGFI